LAKILLVEDDFSLRDIYSARFTAEGYTVVTASDGEEALAVAVREHPDLIVLDVMMPKISGFDVLDILRSTPETKETKVIMMTALSQEADRKRGEALGVDKYLVKSQVTLEDVVAAVKQSLSGSTPAEPTAKPDASQAPPEATQPTA
jgi:two-component system phosphate regulon response regulator PhoB